jgi:hypothetical protein
MTENCKLKARRGLRSRFSRMWATLCLREQVWMPPLDLTYEALLILGVYLQPGKKPPKNWIEYESLLLGRLYRQLLICSDDRMWELIERGWLLEKPETTDELVDHLMYSDRFSSNTLVSRWRYYLSGSGISRDQLIKTRKVEPNLLRMTQAELKYELDDCSPYEWWDNLKDW